MLFPIPEAAMANNNHLAISNNMYKTAHKHCHQGTENEQKNYTAIKLAIKRKNQIQATK